MVHKQEEFKYAGTEGYLFFRQRLTRMIMYSGFNIYLSQVEDCLSSCDIVDQCCAVGIEDKIVGSRVGLYVILKDGTNKDKASTIILQHCKQHIAEYALPAQIVFVDEFPKTKMGKTDFKTLEDRINNR